MSKFIPASSVQHEMVMQEQRRQYGVKLGTHIRYPDSEQGPFIIRKDKFATLTSEQKLAIKTQGEAILQQLKAPKPTLMKRLKKAARKMLG